MNSEMLTVYHSTDNHSLERVRATNKLFGHESLNPPEGYSGEANLTTDKQASQAFIRAYRGGDQWTAAEGPPHLVTLTFQIPAQLIKKVGTTHLFNCPECATTLTVDARDIPDLYFANRHAGTSPLTKEQAILDQDSGKRRFYEVPLDFLKKVETVEYEYRGIRYPQ